MPRKPSRKTQIKKLDTLARKVVIRRDKGICQKCGKEGTDMSHVVPRSKGYALRWDLQNLKLLCKGCHMFGRESWHKNPMEAWKWFEDKFPDRAEYLEKHRNDLIMSKERDSFIENKLKELEDIWENSE